jgi:hypothetical protein
MGNRRTCYPFIDGVGLMLRLTWRLPDPLLHHLQLPNALRIWHCAGMS